ncbi:MAG: SOS response-associated peptidase, partial [Gammaproteobacteria bacterium]
MCGRFANHVKDMGRWAEVLGDWPTDVQTSYNIAPDA